MPVDYSRRRIAVGRRTVVAVAMAGAIVLVALVAGWVLSRGPAVEMPAVDTGGDGPGAVAAVPGAGAANPTGAGSSPAGAAGGPDATGETVGETAVPAQIIVSVVGLVHRPGIVTVPGTARVADAVHAAGGMLPEADPASVNLAAPLSDGQQILVGPDPLPELSTGGAAPGGGGAGPGGAGTGGAGGSGGSGRGGPVNINTATEAELETVTGIGPATAKKIVAHREANGPFASVDQLEEVPGIGPAKLESMRAEVTV